MENQMQPFQALALSGGGFRGLYTAQILARIESDIGEPIGSRFDLIAGTSIGGILALAVALEIPAQRIVDLFTEHGDAMFKRRLSLWGFLRASYSSQPLARLLEQQELFGDRVLSTAKHPVIVPAINYTTGKPVLFKTAHHPSFKTDHAHRLVDIALATSAAPMYFPRHVFNSNQYVDGGLFANAPGLLALHEAEIFFDRPAPQVTLMSIGTMSSKFTVDPRRNRSGGMLDWGGCLPQQTPKRLFGLAISVQESLAAHMLCHSLTQEQYIHVDDDLTDERARAVALDRTDAAAREVLIGSANERAKICLGDARFQKFLQHRAPTAHFFHQTAERPHHA